MSEYIKERYKKLEEFFIESLGLTPEGFIKKNDIYLLKLDLKAEMRVTPDHHYTVEKNIVLTKGCNVKLAERSKSHKFQPLGYSNYFFIEIVNPQIINFGDLSVKMESFIEAVKL